MSNATEVPPKKTQRLIPYVLGKTQDQQNPVCKFLEYPNDYLEPDGHPFIHVFINFSVMGSQISTIEICLESSPFPSIHPKLVFFFSGRNSASVRCLVGLTSQDGGCLLTSDMSSIKAAPVKYSSTVIGPKYCPGTA